MAEQFVFSDPAQLLDEERFFALSGLEFMQGMRDGQIGHPPISGLLNYRLHEVAEGRVAFRGTAGFAHANPVGAVHGGWYGTLLDSAMACAVMTCVPKGHHYTTLEYKININRALPLGTEIAAVGVVSHAGRSTGVASGEIRGLADGRLYATGLTTCLIRPRP
ncbi:MAG: PaaI family thioesterase [Paracoccaceae bacterium]